MNEPRKYYRFFWTLANLYHKKLTNTHRIPHIKCSASFSATPSRRTIRGPTLQYTMNRTRTNCTVVPCRTLPRVTIWSTGNPCPAPRQPKCERCATIWSVWMVQLLYLWYFETQKMQISNLDVFQTRTLSRRSPTRTTSTFGSAKRRPSSPTTANRFTAGWRAFANATRVRWRHKVLSKTLARGRRLSRLAWTAPCRAIFRFISTNFVSLQLYYLV